MKKQRISRRTLLKGLGIGVVGSGLGLSGMSRAAAQSVRVLSASLKNLQVAKNLYQGVINGYATAEGDQASQFSCSFGNASW